MFVTNSNGKKLEIYFDLTKTTFKERHRNHKAHSTKEITWKNRIVKIQWSLKDQNKTPIIFEKVNSRATTELVAELILFLIKSFGDPKILNQKSELMSKNCHCKNLFIKSVTKNNFMNWCSALYVYELCNKFSILFQKTRKLYTKIL